jgi:hypothetical protein
MRFVRLKCQHPLLWSVLWFMLTNICIRYNRKGRLCGVIVVRMYTLSKDTCLKFALLWPARSVVLRFVASLMGTDEAKAARA